VVKVSPSHPGYDAPAAPMYEKCAKERERWRKWHRTVALSILAERHPDHERLWNRILQYGGYAVVPTIEPDLKKLLNKNRAFIDKRTAILVKGSPCHCHANAAFLWNENRGRYWILTGYALSPDGLWRQHSWNIDSRNVPIESTSKRLMYFGFPLTWKESEKFYDENAF